MELVDTGQAIKQVVELIRSDLLHGGSVTVEVTTQPGWQLTWVGSYAGHAEVKAVAGTMLYIRNKTLKVDNER